MNGARCAQQNSRQAPGMLCPMSPCGRTQNPRLSLWEAEVEGTLCYKRRGKADSHLPGSPGQSPGYHPSSSGAVGCQAHRLWWFSWTRFSEQAWASSTDQPAPQLCAEWSSQSCGLREGAGGLSGFVSLGGLSAVHTVVLRRCPAWSC